MTWDLAQRAWRRTTIPVRRAYRQVNNRYGDLPDFLIIGAQKSGTTALFEMITDHPDCKGNLVKEVHYFDFRYEKGEAWYRAHFPHLRYGKVAGEASPYYLVHPHAPRRIAETVPNARLIAILRDPVERAISHYFHEVRAGREPKKLIDALKAEESRIVPDWERMCADGRYYSRAHQSFSYLQRGRYVEQLGRYWQLFNNDQVLVISSESLLVRNSGVLSNVFEHIGVDPNNAGSAVKRSNVSGNKRGVPANVRSFLVDYFREPNEELFDALGQRFQWQ